MFVLVNGPSMDFTNLTILLCIIDTFASSQMVSTRCSFETRIMPVVEYNTMEPLYSGHPRLGTA